MDSEIFVVFIVFSTFAYIAKTIADYSTKKNLIRQGLVDEKIKYLFTNAHASNSLASVKWGLVLIGIGVSLFAREWIDITDEGMFGIMFLFAGVAFLLYHFLVKNEADKNKE